MDLAVYAKGDIMLSMSKNDRRTSFGDQIRVTFRESGLTRYQLAKRSGIPYSTIHRFMAGDRDIGLSNVERLCAVLDLELRPIRSKRR